MLNDLTLIYGRDKEHTQQLLKFKAKQKKLRHH